ncbi:MAG: metallophosphoesterase [Eubacterium sp.]|nr:metallophosphoesterase [Eubacterium sp.]
MSIWILLLVATGLALVFGGVYLSVAVSRFGLIKRIDKKWQRSLVSSGTVAVCFAAVIVLMGFVNAVIVFLHALAFFALFSLVFRIIRKVSGRDFKICWQGWLAIVSMIVYLAIAYWLCCNVWQTKYTLYTDKNISPTRIAMFADSHIGAVFDGEGFAGWIEEIKKQSPDIVLIPGDYVDDWSNREEMIRASAALGTIDAKYGVWFSFGNHDKGVYGRGRDFSAADLRAELEKNNVHVLEDEISYVGDLCIVGRADALINDRMDISELLRGVDESKYIIVLDHEPMDYEKESQTSADLVLSGHTHGGQLFPVNYVGEWLGINDGTYGYERRNDTDFIVTSGIADWAMKFKTGTKSEYVIIDVE